MSKPKTRGGSPKKLRAARKAATYDPLPPDMTDRQEIALALVLWKSLRCHGALRITGGREGGLNSGDPTYESVAAGDNAIRLAGVCGVKDEFFELLFALKLVKISLTKMEE